MNVVHEFSRFANQYDSHSQVQQAVAQKLIARIPKEPHQQIIDIGAGSGTLYKMIQEQAIPFEHFIALDFSDAMLQRHPSHPKVTKQLFDFNQPRDFHSLHLPTNSTVLSSSALQWSTNLETTLYQISQLGKRFYFSLFTANTFKTLHQIANIQSPIYPTSTIEACLNQHYQLIHHELLHYRLYFNNVREMFQYIKRSGVSGGEQQLSYTEIKRLMNRYPYDYLEFEVLLVEALPKRYAKR